MVVNVELALVILVVVEETFTVPELDGSELTYTPRMRDAAIIGITAIATSLLVNSLQRSSSRGAISFLGIRAPFYTTEQLFGNSS
jgi:hypothetical protein